MNSKALWQAAQVCAPTFPRKSADDEIIQAQRNSLADFVASLEAAADAAMPGYYSVYAFPRGEPKTGAIPHVDCIFIDLDVANDYYQPNPNKPGYDTSFESWRADMSALLARVRMIAQSIRDAGQGQHFRAVLSGHKGIHLYLDFEPIDPANGEQGQFKNGLRLYGTDIMDWLDEIAGGVAIDRWVDVDASDLARLARHPNTPHYGVEHVDAPRWCVPVTIEELTSLTVDDYLDLTAAPRSLPAGWERVPSPDAHANVVQRIRTAASSSSTGGGAARRTSKRSALATYREEVQNDAIDLDDVLFLTKNKPCISSDDPDIDSFRERDDAYDYGEASRAMELSIMGRFIEMDVPVEVIHEYFEPIPGYSESFTNDLIADLLSRNNEYGEFKCVTICGGVDENGQRVPGQAPMFCADSDCSIYNRSDDLQKHQRHHGPR